MIVNLTLNARFEARTSNPKINSLSRYPLDHFNIYSNGKLKEYCFPIVLCLFLFSFHFPDYGFMILTKTNLYQQHASNWKFTKLHFSFLHLFPFTEQTLIKLWQKSMKSKISLFSSIFPSIVVNKNRFKESKEFFYSIILFNFPRRSYYTHFHEYGQ